MRASAQCCPPGDVLLLGRVQLGAIGDRRGNQLRSLFRRKRCGVLGFLEKLIGHRLFPKLAGAGFAQNLIDALLLHLAAACIAGLVRANRWAAQNNSTF